MTHPPIENLHKIHVCATCDKNDLMKKIEFDNRLYLTALYTD